MRFRNYILALALIGNTALAKHVTKAEVVDIIVKAADQAEIPRELLLAVCWVESSYRTKLKPRMDGESKSYGLCQIKLETAQFLDDVYKHRIEATEERLANPYVNAFYGAKYLKYQLTRYKGDWRKAVDAYNKGRHVSSESEYVQRVYQALKRQPKRISFKPLTLVASDKE